MSDYEILFERWVDPKSNLTQWRRYIEAMLADEARYQAFVLEAIEGQDKSPLHRAFYLRLSRDQIGLPKMAASVCLEGLEECLAFMPGPSSNPRISGLYFGGASRGLPPIAQLERAHKLLSLAAYAGHKTAIRHLITVAVIKWANPTDTIFMHMGLDQDDDPFYQMMMRFHQFKDDQIDLQSMIDGIRAVDMPLNFAVVNLVAVILRGMKIMSEETLIEVRPQFIELYTYIKPYLQIKRTLPKNRDPFRIYAEEFKFPIKQFFAEAAQVYECLK